MSAPESEGSRQAAINALASVFYNVGAPGSSLSQEDFATVRLAVALFAKDELGSDLTGSLDMILGDCLLVFVVDVFVAHASEVRTPTSLLDWLLDCLRQDKSPLSHLPAEELSVSDLDDLVVQQALGDDKANAAKYLIALEFLRLSGLRRYYLALTYWISAIERGALLDPLAVATALAADGVTELDVRNGLGYLRKVTAQLPQ